MRPAGYDVIIVGGGVFGLATALELGRRGRSVAVVDRFGSGHPATSSTGRSRSIRVAYDHPFYVNLALQALSGWRRLEHETGRSILHLTGQIDFGPASKLMQLAATVRAAGADIEELDGAELQRLLPELAMRPGEAGLFHADAGTVLADAGMAALLQMAEAQGATIFAPERAHYIDLDGRPTVVLADRRLTADTIVVAAGPWSGPLLAEIGIHLPLAPAIAQVTFLDAPLMVDRPSIAEWQASGDGGVYGHAVPGIGYKVAYSAGAPGWDPDVTDWAPDLEEERRLLGWLSQRMPGAPAKVSRTQRHPWTMTPDADFIVDTAGPVTMACGCSGHAFKFGPALGILVADVMDGKPPPDILRRTRPGLSQGAGSPSATINR
ncbi:N-methyl-L-tryptophan oxidase [soil metagenome]